MNEIVIPDFEKDEFLSSQKPYEWLYQFKDDKFKMTQLREKIKEKAGAVGVKNFVNLWNAYLSTVNIQKGIVIGENVTDFEGQEVELSCGEYVADEFGVSTLDRFGFEIKVCNHPIMPTLRLTNIDTGEEKMKITYRKGKSWRNVIVPKDTLASNNKILEISKYGIMVNSENSKHLVKYLTDVEHLNYNSIEEQNSVGRLGWVGEYGFSPYVDNLVFDGDISFKNMFNAVKSKGSYTKWVEHVKEIRKTSTIARIILASSFASVLVEPFNLLPFFVHLWGGTESGKTVALMLGASVWASPKVGDFIHSFNATIVGQEMAASFCNSLPLFLDELQVLKERSDFDKIIYMLTEGVGKSRGAKAGGLQRLNTWQNCIITTGEMPITNINSGGGAVNRIVEVDCKDEKIFTNAIETVDIIKANYGFAGRIFVEKLQTEEGLSLAKSCQKEFYQMISKGKITDKQSASASLILTADFLINHWIFNDGNVLNIDDITQYLVTSEQVNQHKRAYEFILDTVQANQNKFKTNAFNEFQGEVWGQIEEDCVFINKTVFDTLLKNNGFNSVAFLSWAKRSDLLIVDNSENRNTKRKRLHGQKGLTRCVCLKLQDYT